MNTVIEAKNLSKKFPSAKKPPAFKEWLLKLPGRAAGNASGYFYALKSISFTVDKGECVGIIGKNGAGKSTLLSVMLGTSYPTEGTLAVEGKRTPLLELGAGFHPDLSGKENIVLNGVLLGLTKKEVVNRLDDIIKFSEIEEFIEMPVRTYSSGMYLRLAFSIAIHTNPEVLLIDEILAVGDESFQKKSGDALTKLIKGGVTTVFVSHNLDAVRNICSRAIWLDHGEIRASGKPDDVIRQYMESAKPAA